MFKDLDFNGNCRLLYPYAQVTCDLNYMCDFCEIPHRIQQNRRDREDEEFTLFGRGDVLRQTPKGGGLNWYMRPIVLKPDAMRRLGIKVNLVNQILIAYDGSGVFARNPAGMIDGYLVCDRNRRYTFSRHDVYGVPNEQACAKYFEYFGINLNRPERRMDGMK